MFFGEFEHTIDEKGRVIIPARFRQKLQDGMFLSRGLDGCLFVHPLDSWEMLVKKIANLRLSDPSARNFSRLILSAVECKMDKQGRILIPAHLREFAGIKNEVVIVGVNSRLEIWSKERWEEIIERLEKDSSLFAEQFAQLNI